MVIMLCKCKNYCQLHNMLRKLRIFVNLKKIMQAAIVSKQYFI